MTTNTVKHMPADAAPIELAGMFLEWQRIEDAKAELAEQSKDLFKAAKDKGYDTKAMRAVFREKRVELEASPEDVAKAEEAEAKNDLYRSALDRGLTARARPAHDAREIIEEFPPHDLEPGELTDTQESGCSYSEASISAVSPASDESETDDVGATASSTNSNSPAAIPLGAANSAGEAPSSSPASPARHSDDDIPAFIKQDKPGCLKLKDGHCRISFATSALCAECNQHRAISRASA